MSVSLVALVRDFVFLTWIPALRQFGSWIKDG